MGSADASLRRAVAQERGTTLIEVLVVSVSAIVVALALWAIQDLVVRQTGRVFARVDATQEARIAIETIENRMHSACVSEGVTPIIGGTTAAPQSTGSSVAFISRYGSAARVTPEKHVIALGTDGRLTDTTYANTGGTAPNYTFSTSASSTKVLLENAAAQPGVPVFQYFAYGVAKDASGNAYVDAADNPYVMLLDGTSSLPGGLRTAAGTAVPNGTWPANNPQNVGSPLAATPLSLADARLAAAVKVSLLVSAGGKLGDDPRYTSEATPVTNSIVLRLTPPPADGPLQTVRPCG